MLTFCQRADEVAQHWIANALCGFGPRHPLHFALAFLRPVFLLSLYLQGKDVDRADDDCSSFESLLVGEPADRPPANPSHNAGLFPSLACGGHVRSLTLYRPALGNNPSSGLTRGHQQHFRSRSFALPVRLGRVLDPPRWRSFFRIGHRCSTNATFGHISARLRGFEQVTCDDR
jgi:hypothetical protein